MNQVVLFQANEPTTLHCNARGGPNNTFLWFFNDVTIQNASMDVLKLDEVEGGEYTCRVSNAAGSDEAKMTLTGTMTVPLLLHK